MSRYLETGQGGRNMFYVFYVLLFFSAERYYTDGNINMPLSLIYRYWSMILFFPIKSAQLELYIIFRRNREFSFSVLRGFLVGICVFWSSIASSIKSAHLQSYLEGINSSDLQSKVGKLGKKSENGNEEKWVAAKPAYHTCYYLFTPAIVGRKVLSC